VPSPEIRRDGAPTAVRRCAVCSEMPGETPWRAIWLMLAIIVVTGASRADVVVEWSGRESTGELISADDSTLTFRTTDGAVLRFNRELVDRIVFSEWVRTASGDIAALDRQGRTELAVFGSMYGMANGLMLAGVAEMSGGPTFLSMLAGGTLGLYVPLRWSQSRSVGDGRAELMIFGGTWGMYQGMLWPVALAAETSLGPSAETVLLSGIIGGAAGIAAAGLATADRNFSAGDAAIITSLPGWSTLYWYGMLMLLTPAGTSVGADIFIGSTLIAGNLGIAGGALLARKIELSRGDVRLLNVCGLLGATAGGTVLAFAGARSASTISGTVMACALLGKLLAWSVWTGPTDNRQTASTLGSFRLGPTLVSRGTTPSRPRLTPGIGASFTF
jgi:hypothetical protein